MAAVVQCARIQGPSNALLADDLVLDVLSLNIVDTSDPAVADGQSTHAVAERRTTGVALQALRDVINLVVENPIA